MIFFIQSFLFFFFVLRVCVSTAHMGCMLIGKCELWHSSKGIPNTLGKEKTKWNEDEGRKWSLGWKDHPLCCFLIIHVPSFPFLYSLPPFSLYPLQHLHLFFSLTSFKIQNDSQGTSSDTKNLSPTLVDFLFPAITFYGTTPTTQLSEASESSCFDFPAVFLDLLHSLLLLKHMYLYGYFLCQRLQ